jgi:hypothetical protein
MNIALWVLQILFAALFMLHAVLHLFPSPRLISPARPGPI